MIKNVFLLIFTVDYKLTLHIEFVSSKSRMLFPITLQPIGENCYQSMSEQVTESEASGVSGFHETLRVY